MSTNGVRGRRRRRPVVHLCAAVLAVTLTGCGAGQDGRTGAEASPSSPGSSTPSVSASPESAESPVAYSSHFDAVYLDADKVSTPDLPKVRSDLDQGISPVITLGDKFGPFTRAEIAQWGPDVRAYYARFIAGLRALSDYAAAKQNDTAVYFADEHEAVIKIKQHKYDFSGYGLDGVPSVADSAAAWNMVMGAVARSAPDVVRVYWYGGGGGVEEDDFAADLDPDLVQMATFDPYRWKHDSSSDTAESLWGARISHLKSQPWMQNADGSLKPWGLTEWGTDVVHGDESNARFVTETVAYLKAQGAAFAIYFDRVDSHDSSNDFVLTDGRQPKTLRAYRATLTP